MSEHYQSLSRDTSITQIAFGSASFFHFLRQATTANTGRQGAWQKKRGSATSIYVELHGCISLLALASFLRAFLLRGQPTTPSFLLVWPVSPFLSSVQIKVTNEVTTITSH